MKLNVKSIGFDVLEKKFSKMAGKAVLDNVDKVTETYTRKMANESAGMAPVKDNLLAPSIAASPQRVSGEKGVWEYGSNIEYARRQEYENKTHKGFIRKSVWNNREPYREAVKREMTKG